MKQKKLLTLFLTVLSQIGDVCIDLGYLWKDLYIIGCDMKFKKMMMEWDFTKKRPLPEYGLNQPQNNHDSDAPVIFELQHVSFSYDGVTKVLQDISLTIHEGESIALVGENGAGKSTLVKLLLGLYEPDEGEIYFKGKNYRELDMNEFVKQIGVVFQDFRLLQDRDVYSNIAFAQRVIGVAPREIKKNVSKVLALVGLSEKYRSNPNELSGGEQQRVALARAIVNKPQILLADEPTGNLDPENSWEIMKLLDKVNRQGTTVIVVTHNMEIVERMNKRVITMKKGVKVSDSKVVE